MWVIDSLACTLLERVATGDWDAVLVNQRIENGLLQRSGPDIRGKGFAVDGDVDAPMCLIRDDGHALASRLSQGASRQADAHGKKGRRYQLIHTPSLLPSPADFCR